jgi:hypothetical protein
MGGDPFRENNVKRYFLLLTMLVLAVSACTIRVDVGIDVNEDESGTFSLFMGFDEEFQQLAEQGGAEGLDMTEGLQDVPEGWTVEEVVEDGFEGVRISSDFNSLDELNTRVEELGGQADAGATTDFLSDVGLTHDGDEFRFRADVSGLDEGLTDAVGESGGDELFEGLDPSALFEDLFEIRLKLTLPGEIGANNADEVDGNTLIWNVGLGDEGGTFEAVSSTGDGSSALLYVGIGVAALVVVGVAITAIRRRREEAAVTAVTSAPVTTEAPPFDPVD